MSQDIQHTIDRVYTRAQTAEILGCSKKTVQRLDAAGHLQRVQISDRCIGYRDSVIRAFLDSRTGNAS